MRYLLHLINVYVVEDVPFCPGLVGTVVKLIQEKVRKPQTRSRDMNLGANISFVDSYYAVELGCYISSL